MFIIHLLKAGIFIHWDKIHQHLNLLIFMKLKALSLTVRLQFILTYQHLSNQLLNTANQSDASKLLFLHAEYEVFSKYNLPANVCPLPSLAPQYTLIRPYKADNLHASQVYTLSNKDQWPNAVPNTYITFDTNEKKLNLRISFH